MTTRFITLADGVKGAIMRCSKQDYDILKRENEAHLKLQFRSHCRRVWQRLDPSVRDRMRKWIIKDEPEHNDDLWCVEEIEKLLKTESLPYFQHLS